MPFFEDNRDYDQRLHDYQLSVLEQIPKAIQGVGLAAEANVGFRLENAGDALREIVGNGVADYYNEKLDRIEQSLIDSEWRLSLSQRGTKLIDLIQDAIDKAPEPKTQRAALALDLMLAVSDRDVRSIKLAINEIRQTAPGTPAKRRPPYGLRQFE